MKKDITRFGGSLIIAVLLLIIIDFIIGFVADYVVDKMPNYSGAIAKDNYRLHRLETDIVILGSSRGSHHYVTSLLGDSIDNYKGKHYSIYNAAIDGLFANSNSCAAEMIISRYKPKLVIIDITEGQLSSEDIATDIKFTSPFYKRDSIVRKYLDNIGFEEKMLMKSSLYRYNGKAIRIASSFLRKKTADDGYLPLYGSSIDTTKYNKPIIKNPEIRALNPYSETNFRCVLKKYTSLGVPLIIASSPSFRPSYDNNKLRELCNEYNVPFIDLYDSQYFNTQPELFKDATHLNNNGAHAYTKIFFKQLKPYLDNIK